MNRKDINRHQHGGNIYAHAGVIDFSANINPLGMPPVVREAAMQGVNDACHYPEAENRRLVRAIADAEAAAGMPVSASNVICGNGAAELIFLLCRTIRPKAAIVMAPSFAEYAQAIYACGGKNEWIALREKDSFAITRQTLLEMEKRIETSRDTDWPVEMLFMCQPNNPTGQLADEAYMDAVLAMCKRYHLWLVLDACFIELLDEDGAALQRQITAKCLKYERILVLKAFTKSYAMAGLRLGYLLGMDEECLNAMRQSLQPWNVSLPAQYAGLAALEVQDFLKESRKYLAEEKAWLLSGLGRIQEKGFIEKIYGHAANFIFFRAGKGLAERMLAHGLLIRDCGNYQGLGEGYYRIAVRTHGENRKLIKALEAEAGIGNDAGNGAGKNEENAGNGRRCE